MLQRRILYTPSAVFCGHLARVHTHVLVYTLTLPVRRTLIIKRCSIMPGGVVGEKKPRTTRSGGNKSVFNCTAVGLGPSDTVDGGGERKTMGVRGTETAGDESRLSRIG